MDEPWEEPWLLAKTAEGKRVWRTWVEQTLLPLLDAGAPLDAAAREKLLCDLTCVPQPVRPAACRNGPLRPCRVQQFLGQFPKIWREAIADPSNVEAAINPALVSM
jgi:hypothetical protein